MELFSSVFGSPLGSIKLQCSGTHLVSASFIDMAENWIEDHHSILEETTLQWKAYFEGKIRNFNIPLYQDGTEFQKKVWDLLSTIPYGKTISYNDLAKQ